MPRRRQHRNHHQNRINRFAWTQSVGAVSIEGIQLTNVASTSVTTSDLTAVRNAWGGGGGGGGVTTSPARPRRRARTRTVVETAGGPVTITNQDPRLIDTGRLDTLRGFVIAHHDGFYERHIGEIIDPRNRVSPAAPRWLSATMSTDIDHERETKRTLIVGVGVIRTVPPNYFVLVVHPDHRRTGIGRALFGHLSAGPTTPTSWAYNGTQIGQEGIAFMQAMGLVRVEDGVDAARWGYRQSPTWWE